MPIYEFYCADCHRLYNFFSSRIDTATRPPCPRCGRARLERRPARFATLRHQAGADDDPLDEIADERLAGAMDSMMDEMSGLEDGVDPRRLAGMLSRLGDASGLELGPKMRQLLGRLEAGADADQLDEELGDAGDEAGDASIEEFFRLKRSAAWLRRRRPALDETLYFL